MKQLEIKAAACGNVTGDSYIETPPILKPLKRSVLNVVNKRDNFCFLYCIAAAIFCFVGRPHSPKIHRKILNDYLSTRSYCQCRCPPFLLFEKRNRCSINVYQLENSRLVSVYHSKNRKGWHKIDLSRLLENKNIHYCLIKNISNLIHFLCRSKSKLNKGPKSRSCRNCFQPIVKPNFKKTCTFLREQRPTRDSNAYRVAICRVC